MQAGGVVRALNSWGTLTLPQRMKRHVRGEYVFRIYFLGIQRKMRSYWTMHFDTSPRTLQSLNKLMRQDPRVIRWTVVKQGSKVEDVATEGQKILRGEPHRADDLTD